MTYFFWLRNLCRLTFISERGLPMPITGESHVALCAARINVVTQGLPNRWYVTNDWIWR